MPERAVERKLVAILAADVAGYSRLIGLDEEGTLARLKIRAVAVQRACVESETPLPQDRRIQFRVGINLGDIVVEGDDILGDGVNIAARLEGIAEPGGICISGVVHDQVRGKVELDFDDLGESLRNIARPVRAYRVVLDKLAAVAPAALPLPDKPSI